MTFSLAITRIAGLIGWEEAARATDRSERTVRLWSEGDAGTLPSLDQAMALDRAYLAAGGGEALILESYARQIDVAMAAALACQRSLSDEIAETARESAEAIASSIRVTQPGATATAIYHAIAETEEASGACTRLLARLKSFLPGNVAEQDQQGSI
ncbi:MAG TPA: hypothetical protein VNS79_03760 [Sphingobium sp.]|nr:hypothetical protein [Sphingobium sp.]